MATYNFRPIPAWVQAGSFARIGLKKSATFPCTLPAGGAATVVQGGVTQVGYVQSDATGMIPAFTTTDVPSVVVDFGVGQLTINSLEAITAGASSAAAAAASATSASTSASNAAASAAAAAGKVAKGDLLLNVKDSTYGAVGNGSTDDTAAIQLALDAARTAGGATVYFPRGTYIVSSYLRVGSFTTLRGEGWASILKLKNAATNSASSDILHNYNLNNGFPTPLSTPGAPTITYLAGSGSLAAATYSYRVSAVNSNGETLASTAATGVASAGSARMQVAWTAVSGATGYNVYGRVGGSEKLIAENISASPYIDDGSITPVGLVSDFDYSSTRATTQDTNICLMDLCLDGNVANNASLTANAGAAYFNNVDGLSIANVRVQNTTRHGIVWTWCNNVTVDSPIATNCGTAGSFTALMFYMRNTNVTISSPVCSGNGFGILLDHYTSNVTISSPVCTGNTDSGIGVDEGSSKVAIGNPVCTGNGGHGITITDGQTARNTRKITIGNPVCTDNGLSGIVVAGASDFTIGNATVTDNGNFGLLVNKGTDRRSANGVAHVHALRNTSGGVRVNLSDDIFLTGRASQNVVHGVEVIDSTGVDVDMEANDNNSTNAAGFICGIKLSGTGARHVVKNCKASNKVNTFGQHAGIYFAGTTLIGTRYGGNVVFNNKSNQFFSDTPANDIALTY